MLKLLYTGEGNISLIQLGRHIVRRETLRFHEKETGNIGSRSYEAYQYRVFARLIIYWTSI